MNIQLITYISPRDKLKPNTWESGTLVEVSLSNNLLQGNCQGLNSSQFSVGMIKNQSNLSLHGNKLT